MGSNTGHANIFLFGLEESLAQELGSALGDRASLVHAEAGCDDLALVEVLKDAKPDLVFCRPESYQLLSLLSAVSSYRPGVPVVVVTRHPNVHEWLDAMDAGAADYCAAPFEARHLQWILESNLH
jgi:DNA-binding NtrC family response regulator